jgi:hypothetical protein
LFLLLLISLGFRRRRGSTTCSCTQDGSCFQNLSSFCCCSPGTFRGKQDWKSLHIGFGPGRDVGSQLV